VVPHIRKRIKHTLSKLVEAEQSGNAKAIQGAYEELFTYCYQNGLDLNAVLVETKDKLKREAAGIERSPRSGGFLAFVLRQWPVVRMKLRLHLSLFSPIFVLVFAGLLLSAPLAAGVGNIFVHAPTRRSRDSLIGCPQGNTMNSRRWSAAEPTERIA